MKESDFPDVLNIALDPKDHAGKGQGLLAFRTEGEAIDGDGPTVVAKYKLVGLRTYGKHLVEVEPGPKS